MSLYATTSQTVGPYLHIGLTWLIREDLVGPGVTGEPITIQGRVLDGDGKPVNDALVEIWQANAHGKYAHPEDRQSKPLEPGFKGFGRSATDDNGAFRFRTVKPGRVPGPGGALQAPHIAVTVFSRGMLRHVYTRIYFSDEAKNDVDPILALVPAERRATVIAKRADRNGQAVYTFDIRLQGDVETVFFDI